LLFGHTNPITALAWAPDGSVLASGSADRTVILYRIHGLPEPGSPAATLAGMGGAVRTLAFSRDGAELVTGGDDHAVRFWDSRPDEELDVVGSANGPALAARWAGKTIVGLWREVVQTYDARTHQLLHALPASGVGAFTALGASRDGAIIGAGTDTGMTIVWDGRTGVQLASRAGRGPVSAVGVSPDGDLVASGDSGGALHVWKSRGGSLWLRRQQGPVADVAFSPDGSEIVTAGRQGVVAWSAISGRRVHVLISPAGVATATFSPDGRLVAAAGLDDVARIWFARSGRLYRVLRGHTRPLTDVEFSADGRLLVTAGRDSDVRVWSIAKGLGHVLQRRAFGPVSSAAFDPSGRWVAAAAPISVIIWSVNGRQLFYVRGHKAVLTGVSFAPDSATVLSSSRDGTIRTYRCVVCVGLSTLVHMAEVQLARTR
jgi:WD40 repeat protein